MQIFAASIFVLELYADLDRDAFSLSYMCIQNRIRKNLGFMEKSTPS